jgi:hypothetical protein
MIQCLERLPLLLVAFMLVAPGLAGLISLGLGRSWLVKLEGPPLWGIPDTQQELKYDFFARDFQKSSEAWVNRHLPLRPLFVRSTNQLFYSLFQKSYAENEELILGTSRELYSIRYIHRYCSVPTWKYPLATADGRKIRLIYNPTFGGQDMTQWIEQLQQISTFYRKRGKTFLYVIAPSKAAVIPERIPKSIACAPPDQRDIEYKQQVKMLDQSGLPYVDAYKLMTEAKSQYDVPMFPRGGIHWNMLGATIATKQMYEKIGQLSQRSLPPFEFSYHVTHQPSGTDQDLYLLLNLAIPDNHYPVPQVNIKPVPNQRLKLAMLGDSFIAQPLAALTELGAFCQIDEYRYVRLRNQFPPTNRCGSTRNPKQHYQEILDADVLVVMQTSAGLNVKYLNEFRNELVRRDPTIVQSTKTPSIQTQPSVSR